MLRNLLVVVSAFWGAGIFLSTGVSSVRAADLKETIPPLIEAHQGKVAVVIRHLGTGEQFVWRENEVQPAASLIKLPVMVAAYRMVDQSKLDLTKLITLKDEDKVPGSGILSGHFSAGLTLSLRDAVRLMIRYSDNTATNLVVDQIGLPTTADTMKSLGFPETRLNSKVYRGDTSIAPERSRIYGLGSTTALEAVNLLEQLHKGTIASPESCAAMIEHLLACDDKQMLVRELPSGTKVAHKTGAVNESRCSAGIVYGPENSFAICVLTTDNKDRSWKDDNAAQVLIGEIARAAFDHFNPEWQRNTPPECGDLKIGAIGTRVELLQRTLNARMIPSAGLGVDGDFGPATEAVVRYFQETHALPVTGIIDAAFWDTLGPVVDQRSFHGRLLIDLRRQFSNKRHSLFNPVFQLSIAVQAIGFNHRPALHRFSGDIEWPHTGQSQRFFGGRYPQPHDQRRLPDSHHHVTGSQEPDSAKHSLFGHTAMSSEYEADSFRQRLTEDHNLLSKPAQMRVTPACEQNGSSRSTTKIDHRCHYRDANDTRKADQQTRRL